MERCTPWSATPNVLWIGDCKKLSLQPTVTVTAVTLTADHCNDILEELKCGPCEKSVLSSCDHDNDYIPSSFLLEGGRGQEISSIHISSLSFDDCVVVVLSSLLWKNVPFHPDLEGLLGLPWINPRINPLQANLSDDKLCWDKFCSVQSVYIIIHALSCKSL